MTGMATLLRNRAAGFSYKVWTGLGKNSAERSQPCFPLLLDTRDPGCGVPQLVDSEPVALFAARTVDRDEAALLVHAEMTADGPAGDRQLSREDCGRERAGPGQLLDHPEAGGIGQRLEDTGAFGTGEFREHVRPRAAC